MKYHGKYYLFEPFQLLVIIKEVADMVCENSLFLRQISHEIKQNYSSLFTGPFKKV